MRNKYKPYIRRANGKEKSESFRVAYRLAFYQSLNKPFYVMVQRGWPNLAIEVGPNRREVARLPLGALRRGFKTWANNVKRRNQGR